MIAKLPATVQDIVDAWPLILGVFAGIAGLRRQQRVWMRQNISEPIAAVSRRLDGVAEEAAATRHLVTYHLGKNGTTTPVHSRLDAIEQASAVAADIMTTRAGEVRQQVAERQQTAERQAAEDERRGKKDSDGL